MFEQFLVLIIMYCCVENGEPLTVLGTGKALRQFVYSQVSSKGYECDVIIVVTGLG